MLAEAQKKNAYQALHEGTLGNPLDLPSNFFGGVISVGTFTFGHASSEAFDELIRITKPGGYIVFTIRPDHYANSDFKQKQAKLEADGSWALVEVGDPFPIFPKTESDVQLQVWVYRVTTEAFA